MQLNQAQSLAKRIVLSMTPYCEHVEIAGSIRRGKPDVKDIEIVAVPRWENAPAEEQVRSLFALSPSIPNVNTLHFWAMKLAGVRWIKPGTSEIVDWQPKPGGKYWRGLIDSKIKLDLFLASPENFGIIYVIRTGSAEFTTALVSHAKQVGLPCVEGYLTRNGEQIATPNEQAVFDLLNLEYVEPHLRRDGRDLISKG